MPNIRPSFFRHRCTLLQAIPLIEGSCCLSYCSFESFVISLVQSQFDHQRLRDFSKWNTADARCSAYIHEQTSLCGYYDVLVGLNTALPRHTNLWWKFPYHMLVIFLRDSGRVSTPVILPCFRPANALFKAETKSVLERNVPFLQSLFRLWQLCLALLKLHFS